MFCTDYKEQPHKSHGRGEDPHLEILSYITTPLNYSLPSPAELLNSRKYRCLLPVQIKQQNYTHQYRNIMQRQKYHQAKYYNRNTGDLPSLKTGGTVYVQLVPKMRNWIPGHIIKKLSPRTYKIKTHNGGIYIRNRKFIKPRYTDSRQCPQTREGTIDPVKQTPYNHRPKQITRRPQRLIETMNLICIILHFISYRHSRTKAFCQRKNGDVMIQNG